MQPYPNPNYFAQNQYPGSYQPMQTQNPYAERLAQLQQYQQSFQMPPAQMQGMPQQSGIVGKVVNDFSELTANDVPMNGNAAFFPKSDGSEIQARAWTPNGTIQTVIYRPVQPESNEQGTNVSKTDFNSLNEDMKALREDVKGVREMIEKSMDISSPKTTRGKKSEVVDNE